MADTITKTAFSKLVQVRNNNLPQNNEPSSTKNQLTETGAARAITCLSKDVKYNHGILIGVGTAKKRTEDGEPQRPLKRNRQPLIKPLTRPM